MRVLVTGAGGYLGAAVLRSAAERGHQTISLVRTGAAEQAALDADPTTVVVRGDLMRLASWSEHLEQADAVIHLAATMTGGLYSQFSGTVVATEGLIAAMKASPCKRLVHISTFSVYDYTSARAGTSIDESSLLEADLYVNDAYTQTKIVQERLVRDAACDGLSITILRPGAVWGAGNLWSGGLGHVVGPLWLRCGDGVVRKLSYIENCADAIVLAVERPSTIGATLNIVDDPVTQCAFAKGLARRGVALPRALPVSFQVWRLLVRALHVANRRLAGGRARLPSMLNLKTVDARFKPFNYPNDRARAALGWTPRYSLDDALDRAVRVADRSRS